MASTGKDINFAKQLLERGELVAIPTETVYGLAANALNSKAVTEVFNVKRRPFFDPLILHIPSAALLGNYAENVPDKAIHLAEKFWPGPLTLVLNKKKSIPDIATAGLPTAGFRCPDHPLTRNLLEIISFPLAAPSANPFGYISPTLPLHVESQLGNLIPYILDGGPCRIGIESTIIGFVDGQGVIYRKGGISTQAIEDVIGEVRDETSNSTVPNAPGQLASHYAPRKPMIVGDIHALLNKHDPSDTGVLSFSKNYGTQWQKILSPSGDVNEAARNLFSAMHELDTMPVRIIVAEWVPSQGLGVAINDRLTRASANYRK